MTEEFRHTLPCDGDVPVKSIIGVINEAIGPDGGACLPCDRVDLDYDRHPEYQDSEEHPAHDVFEYPSPRSRSIQVAEAPGAIPSILRFFLDGSRRTYKIADVQHRGRYLPLVAGQVGVAVLQRNSAGDHLKPLRDLCCFENVLAFPDALISQEDIQSLSDAIRRDSRGTFELLRYTVKRDRDPVDLGVAKIMSHMADLELRAVHVLSERHMLANDSILVKDGPLRYKNIKGRRFDITQFRNVIGVSKTFRPSFTIGTGRGKRDVGAMTASLEAGQRTPVFKTSGEDRPIGVWYLRIRPRSEMTNPLQGIIKIECYAVDDREAEEGLHADRVNTISAHLLRERNVTPYGQDSRWASHLYPVFSAEYFIKSSFLSDTHFEGFF